MSRCIAKTTHFSAWMSILSIQKFQTNPTPKCGVKRKKLFDFIRHGEAEHNVVGIINNDPCVEINLTEKGKKQCEAAAEKLKDVELDKIISSDFIRCQQTAVIINKFHNLPIDVDKRVTEFYVGFEGKTDAEYNEASKEDSLGFKLKGYESWLDVKSRVKEFIEDLKTKNYVAVLVVSHSDPVGAAVGVLKELPDMEARFLGVKNCELFEFDI